MAKFKKMEANPALRPVETDALCGVPACGTRIATRTRNNSSVHCSRLYLSLGEARRLVESVSHGGAMWPTWQGVTVNFDLLNSPSAPAMVMRTLADHIRHWQAKRGIPPFYLWVRESGECLGDHAHVLVAVPDGNGRTLSHALGQWVRGPSIRGDTPKGTLHSRSTDPMGWLLYCLKTLAPADAERLKHDTGLKVSTERPGAPVTGQRIGIARALAPKARREAATPYAVAWDAHSG